MVEKSLPLSEEEINEKRIKFNPFIISLIEECRRTFQLQKSEFRILDFGCGRGKNVAALLSLGYDVYGVDVDPLVVNSAQKGLSEDGNRINLIQIDNKTDFEEGFFHFVISEHVIEHVQHFKNWVDEINRILKPKGFTYHVYPPYGRFIEAHVKMPFIHYLGASLIRDLLIKLYLLLGIHPKWKIDDPTQYFWVYRNYLDNKVYHKKRSNILETFSPEFECEFITHKNPKVVKPLRRIVKANFISVFIAKHLIPRLYVAHLLAIKHNRN